MFQEALAFVGCSVFLLLPGVMLLDAAVVQQQSTTHLSCTDPLPGRKPVRNVRYRNYAGSAVLPHYDLP